MRSVTALAALTLLAACGGGGGGGTTASQATSGSGATGGTTTAPAQAPAIKSVSSEVVATFAAPWAMAFLPDGQMLVTERPLTTTVADPVEPGRLRLVTATGTVSAPLAGVPANVGLLDVVLDPRFAETRWIYVSFMERDPTAPRVGRAVGDPAVQPAGLALMRAKLTVQSAGVATLSDASVIWRQRPKIVTFAGSGEPGGRIAFSPDGRYLFLTAGDRQELAPDLIQSLATTVGKIVRLFPDGTVPADNPFAATVGALPEVWTRGHRNPYGLAFDANGRLWEHEMGPKGGDEFNLIEAGGNYGWPNVSYGDTYDNDPIPKPAAGDGYVMSAVTWTPVIAPSGMIFYSGAKFAAWKGDAIISGLQSKGLVRVRVSGTTAAEVERIDLGQRIRSVTQGPDGAIWVLEDQPTGRLLKLSPVF